MNQNSWGLGKRKWGGGVGGVGVRWLGWAVVLEHWDKFPGTETIHQRQEPGQQVVATEVEETARPRAPV